MSDITVRADELVKRLLGRRIRIQCDGFDGYGEVLSVEGDNLSGVEGHTATVKLEVTDADDQQ